MKLERPDPQRVETKARTKAAEHVPELMNGDRGHHDDDSDTGEQDHPADGPIACEPLIGFAMNPRLDKCRL
jgi:hypothetical protein